MRYPFRFYGRQPSDWKGHWQLSLQFKQAPTERQLQAMASDFVLLCSSSIVNVDESAWRFSGPFAEVAIAIRWSGERKALAVMADFFRSLHHSIPIEDVVNLVAVESNGSWDRWSLAQKPADPRPDRETLAKNDVFETALAAARKKRAEAKVDRALQKQKPDGVRLLESGLTKDAMSQYFERGLSWPDEVRAAFNTPNPPTHRVNTRRTTGERNKEGYHPVRRGTDLEHPLAIFHDEEGYAIRYAMLDETQTPPAIVDLELKPEPTSPIHAVPARCGEELFISTSAQIYRGRGPLMEQVWKPNHNHGNLLRIVSLGEDRLLAITEKKLVVLDADAPGDPIAERANSKSAMGVVVSSTMAEGAVLIATKGSGPTTLSLLVGDVLKRIGSVPKELYPGTTNHGELVFYHGERVFQLAGVVEAAAAMQKKAKKKKSSTSKSKGSKKPAAPFLEPMELGEVPSETELNPPPHGGSPGFVRRATLFYSQDGSRVVGLAPRDRPHATSWVHLFMRTGDGPVEECTHWFESAKDWYVSHASLAPDGSCIDLCSGYNAWRVDLASGVVEELWTDASTDVHKAEGIQYLDSQRSILLGERGIVLLKKGAEGWEVAHRVKLSKSAQLAYLPEHQLAVVRGTGSARLTVFAVLSTKFKKLMQDKDHTISRMVAGGGMVFLSNRAEAWMLAGAEASAAFEVAKDKK